MPEKSTFSNKKYGVVICGGDSSITPAMRISLYNTGCGSTDSEWRIFIAPNGEIPSKDDINTFDGFWMFGSFASSLDSETWIRELEAFVQTVANRKSDKPRLVGICFSHHLFAKALGGKVGRNPSKTYVFKNETILPGRTLAALGLEDPFNLAQSHGECVLELPPGARSIAKSDSCEHEVVLFRDNIIGFQGHPDYSGERMTGSVLPLLIERGLISAETAKAALRSFEVPTHERRVNEFLISFMTR